MVVDGISLAKDPVGSGIPKVQILQQGHYHVHVSLTRKHALKRKWQNSFHSKEIFVHFKVSTLRKIFNTEIFLIYGSCMSVYRMVDCNVFLHIGTCMSGA